MPAPKKELKDIFSEKPIWDVDEIFRLFTKKQKERRIRKTVEIHQKY